MSLRWIVVVVALAVGSSAADAGRGGGRSSSSRSSGSRSSSTGRSGTGSSSSSHSVKGHTTKNGTYVAPHRQTNPDHTQSNNYSAKGNVNPTNGKVGTRAVSH
jgi:hypothetical protein